MAVSVKIEDSLKERIQNLANARQRTPHWIMRHAILEYIDREEKREQFHKDAIQAWENYQTDGLHLSHDEVEQWLDQLESGKNAEIPKCHR